MGWGGRVVSGVVSRLFVVVECKAAGKESVSG